MLLPILLFTSGLLLLWKGADWLIEGCLQLGAKLRIPEIILGLTALAFGTSAPELFVNGIAVVSGKPEIVWGNILGSNIANLGLILGVAGLLIALPVKSVILKRDLPFSVGALAILMLMLKTEIPPAMTLVGALILLATFNTYLYLLFKSSKNELVDLPDSETKLSHDLLKFFSGLLALPLGAKWVVDSAIELALTFGISEAVVALVAVALGTSLPELVTSVVAASKKKPDLAVGNIIGSNIFNILFVLGICGLIDDIPFDGIFYQEIAIILGLSLSLYAFVRLSKDQALHRFPAAVMLLGYLLYVSYTIIG